MMQATRDAMDAVPMGRLEDALRAGSWMQAEAALEDAFVELEDALYGGAQDVPRGSLVTAKAKDGFPKVVGDALSDGASANPVCALPRPPDFVGAHISGEIPKASEKARDALASIDADIARLKAKYPLLDRRVKNLKVIQHGTPRLPGDGTGLGLYHHDGSMTLAAPTGPDAYTLGGFNASESNALTTFRHEFGHYVDEVVLTQAQRREFLGIARQYGEAMARRVSVYAKSGPSELFAESFSVFTHPQYAGDLPAPVDAFMRKVFVKAAKR